MRAQLRGFTVGGELPNLPLRDAEQRLDAVVETHVVFVLRAIDTAAKHMSTNQRAPVIISPIYITLTLSQACASNCSSTAFLDS